MPTYIYPNKVFTFTEYQMEYILRKYAYDCIPFSKFDTCFTSQSVSKKTIEKNETLPIKKI